MGEITESSVLSGGHDVQCRAHLVALVSTVLIAGTTLNRMCVTVLTRTPSSAHACPKLGSAGRLARRILPNGGHVPGASLRASIATRSATAE